MTYRFELTSSSTIGGYIKKKRKKEGREGRRKEKRKEGEESEHDILYRQKQKVRPLWF